MFKQSFGGKHESFSWFRQSCSCNRYVCSLQRMPGLKLMSHTILIEKLLIWPVEPRPTKDNRFISIASTDVLIVHPNEIRVFQSAVLTIEPCALMLLIFYAPKYIFFYSRLCNANHHRTLTLISHVGLAFFLAHFLPKVARVKLEVGQKQIALSSKFSCYTSSSHVHV